MNATVLGYIRALNTVQELFKRCSLFILLFAKITALNSHRQAAPSTSYRHVDSHHYFQQVVQDIRG